MLRYVLSLGLWVLFSGAVLVHSAWSTLAEAKLARSFARLEERGFLLSEAERGAGGSEEARAVCDRFQRLSDRLAARERWTEALAVCTLDELERLDDETATRIAEHLAPLQDLLDGLDELLASDECAALLSWGESTYPNGPDLERRPLPRVARHWTELMCHRAVLDARDPERRHLAAPRLGRALDLLRLMDNGTVVACSIRRSGEQRAVRIACGILARGEADPRAMQRELDPRLAADAEADDLLRTLRGDFEHLLPIRRPARLSARTTLLERGFLAWVVRPARIDELEDGARSYARVYESAQGPSSTLLAELRSFEPCDSETEDVSELLESAWWSTVELWHTQLARTALARAGLAVQAFRAEHGRWPEHLREVDGAPADPHTGRAFAYAVVDGRAVIGPTAMNHDIVWRSGG